MTGLISWAKAEEQATAPPYQRDDNIQLPSLFSYNQPIKDREWKPRHADDRVDILGKIGRAGNRHLIRETKTQNCRFSFHIAK